MNTNMYSFPNTYWSSPNSFEFWTIFQ
jgi:hypothetical protein